MTLPPAPSGPRGSRRIRALPLVAGVAVALVADATALFGWDLWAAPLRSATPLPHVTPQFTVTPGPAVGPASTVAAPTPARTVAAPGSLAPKATTGKPAPTASKPTMKRTTGAVPVTDALKRGIVLIEASNGSYASAGTGMVLSESGEVLTNYHVVRSSTDIVVTLASTHDRYAAKLVGRDATRDVALLQLQEAGGLAPITTDPDPIAVGDMVVTAGNAAGQGYLTADAGEIVSKNQNIRVRGAEPDDPQENLSGLLETNAHAEPGDSGGPLFDNQYEVTGMTTAGAGTGTGSSTAYAVPIANALQVVQQIRNRDETGSVVIGPRPCLGIVVADDGSGVLRAKSVEDGSPAAKAGIKAGDRIVSLNGIEVSTRGELAGALDHLQPGETVPIGWNRGGAAKSASVTLGTSKAN